VNFAKSAIAHTASDIALEDLNEALLNPAAAKRPYRAEF
jgi:hypothetical protein